MSKPSNSVTVAIHNHHSPAGAAQRDRIGDIIRRCRDDGWTDADTASAVFVALLNPPREEQPEPAEPEFSPWSP